MSVVQQTLGGVVTLPLVDAAMLDGLRAALGPATDALVARATGILEDRLGQLAALGETPLDDRFGRLAHEIGGVAGQIGLARLSRAALAVEQLSRSGDAAGAAEGLDGLLSIADDTRSALSH